MDTQIYVTRKSAYLGRIIIGDSQIRGKGLGGQIIASLLDYAFDVLGRNKVQLNVFDRNTSAIKCYEKVGFRINPDKKAERVVNEQTWIALNMCIDKEKWKRGT